MQGITAGTTLKYVRGTLRTSREDGLLPPDDLLDLGEDLEGGEAENHFDLDVGALAVAGPVRLGITGRNVLETEFADGAFTLPRQVRVGAAFDAAKLPGTPLTIAVDMDLLSYVTGSGDRRVVALGGEQWLLARRLGLRAGVRFNTVGTEDRAATAGISVSPRSGLYLDGHVLRGGSTDDRGWGVAAQGFVLGIRDRAQGQGSGIRAQESGAQVSGRNQGSGPRNQGSFTVLSPEPLSPDP